MRLVLCDDQQLLLDAFSTALSARGHDVVATARTAEDGVSAAREHQPDVCIMDLGFPVGNGLEATAQICAQSDGVKVLVLSGATDARSVHAALDAGAAGYVPKDTSINDLVRALEQVTDGEVGIDPSLLLAAVRAQPARATTEVTRYLTPRECDVLLRISNGESTKEIARGMGVSYSTARTHVQNALSKLRVSSRLQAAALISREGLAPQLRAACQRL
jgi:two-component system nitrate/nitrite response regulator NarL